MTRYESPPDHVGKCNGKDCGRPITWAKHPTSGRSMPFDVGSVTAWVVTNESGIMIAKPIQIRIPHWQTCPNAADFRRGGGGQ